MATINRPLPAHSEADGRNPGCRPGGGGASSVQQDSGPPGAAQDLGFPPHPQHPIFTRPVLYIPAPPPPPLLHYQWPMPFPYNPFAGFTSMGYGMIVPPPPFPPPPYMDPPGYILPQPHGQPVDYRRLHQPQSAPHQNPNQTRRVRPNHFIPSREMVNSEVQTEPAQRGIRGSDLDSDSGRGTHSNSPCSLTLGSPKQTLSEVVSCKFPCREERDSQVDRAFTSATVGTDFHKRPIESNSCGGTGQETLVNKDLPDQEPVPDSFSKDGNCNLWSSSPDCILPMSSSSQKDDVVLKERRISVPDSLMNWNGGTPQPTLSKMSSVLSQTDDRLSYKHGVEPNKPLSHSSTGSVIGLGSGMTDCTESPKVSEMLFRILRLPRSTIDTLLESSTYKELADGSLDRPLLTFRNEDEVEDLQKSSLSTSAEVQENVTGTYLPEISDVSPHMSDISYRAKRKSNESIWSVESLPAFIPSREWLLQNGILVNEVMEVVENVRLSQKNENPMGIKEGRSLGCASVQMSENCVCPRIQEEEQSPVGETGPEMENSVSEPVDPEESQSILDLEKSVFSASALPGDAPHTPTEKGENECRSSETEASQSPNQHTLVINEMQQRSLSSSEEEMSPNSGTGENSPSAIQLTSQNGVDIEDDGVPIMVQNMAEVSPSRGTLVDCAVQCNKFPEPCCLCQGLNKCAETNRRLPYKSADKKKANDGRNGHVQKKKNQWRSTGQERQFNQQEVHNGYCRGGKSRGGRNPRYY